MEKIIITIGRYCGSGGSFVGKILAKKLGIEFYDRKLLQLASDDSGISEELFAHADEKLKSSLLYKISRNVYKGELIPPESEDFTSNKNLFNYQAKVIKELAQKESCVIIGRCADFILKDEKNVVNVFVSADRDTCVKTEINRLSIPKKDAEARVDKLNKYRAEYYKYYTGKVWNEPKNYDLCLNTSEFSYEQCADLIIDYIEKKFDVKLT